MTHEPQAPLARIKLPPALIIISALAAGAVGKELGLDGPDWGHLPVLHYLGNGLMAGGLLMLILGYGAMMRAWTTIDPGRHTRAIVTRGVFRISRNPIYLGWSVGLFGAGLARSSLLLISISLVMFALLHWAVVLNEEQYLEGAFGDEYRRYKERVRRWL